MERYWYMHLSAEGRNSLFPDETGLRRAVRTLARIAGDRMLLFCLVDEHIYLVSECDKSRAGMLARSILLALRHIAAAPIEPAYVRPVLTRSYLESLHKKLLGEYLPRDLKVPPALWSGSCFLDLFGARLVPNLQLQIEKALPRYNLNDALAAVGIQSVLIMPFTDVQIRAAGPVRLARAAAAAHSVGPELAGNQQCVVEARVAAVVLGSMAKIPTSEMAFALNMSRRAIQNLARRDCNPLLLQAIRKYMAIEAAAEHAIVTPAMAGAVKSGTIFRSAPG